MEGGGEVGISRLPDEGVGEIEGIENDKKRNGSGRVRNVRGKNSVGYGDGIVVARPGNGLLAEQADSDQNRKVRNALVNLVIQRNWERNKAWNFGALRTNVILPWLSQERSVP